MPRASNFVGEILCFLRVGFAPDERLLFLFNRLETVPVDLESDDVAYVTAGSKSTKMRVCDATKAVIRHAGTGQLAAACDEGAQIDTADWDLLLPFTELYNRTPAKTT